MIKAIQDYLRGDSQLVSLLGHTKYLPRIMAFEPFQKKINDYPYIVFNVSPYIAEHATNQYRCEIRIVTDDGLLNEKLTKRVIE